MTDWHALHHTGDGSGFAMPRMLTVLGIYRYSYEVVPVKVKPQDLGV